MKKALLILLFFSGFICVTLTFANALTVNFNNAKIVFIDEDNILKKMDDEGIISDVLSTNANVSHIMLSSQTNLFIVFSSRQELSDGNRYLLTRANTAENTLVGIDSAISSIRWDSDGICKGVQVDGAGNLYYLVYPQSGGLTLRKYVNESNIQDLINDNIYIYNWLVVSDGTVLMSGYTTATSVKWIRKLTPETNLVNLASYYASWMKEFPDNRVYAGIHGNGYVGVYKLPSDLSAFDETPTYISASHYDPEYDLADIAEGHDSDYSYGLTIYYGASIQTYMTRSGASIQTYMTRSNVVYVLAGSGTYLTPAQYYPTPEIIEPTNLIDSVTLMEPCSDKLLIAGLKDSINKLILYDPSTGGSVNMLDENIEVYHMREMYDGHIWFDGLKFTGNRYIMGKIVFSVEYGVGPSGALVKSVTPEYTEIATLSGKLNDFVAVAGSTNIIDGTFQLSSSSYSVNEDAGSMTLTVTRTGGSDGAASVQYATSDGTATAGSDYTSASGTLSWSDGESSSKTITVSITDDSNEEENETFAVTLSNASGASMGSPSSATVTISANDNPAGTLQFSSSTYSVNENGVSVTLTVVRTNGSSGSASVQYATSDGTASAGSDYTSASGTLSWSDGESSSKTITVSITYDSTEEENETFTVTLSNASEASLGAPSSATVTIVDNDASSAYVINDYDGDGKTDIAVFEVSTGYWYILLSSTLSMSMTKFGNSDCTTVGGDFDGDDKSDLAVYESSTGYWYILFSSTLSLSITKFGNSYCTTVAGDYDGDGKTDLAVFERTTGHWYIVPSSTIGMWWRQPSFGNSGCTPMVGDYDGDGITDVAVFEIETGYWYISLSSTSSTSTTKFGNSDCTPLNGDYDGDGKSDLAVFERTTGYWYILYSSTMSLAVMPFGNSGCTPVPGDYDGDGKTDIAVYENATGYWYIFCSSTLELSLTPFGNANCVPVQ